MAGPFIKVRASNGRNYWLNAENITWIDELQSDATIVRFGEDHSTRIQMPAAKLVQMMEDKINGPSWRNEPQLPGRVLPDDE